jgi:hypothetical protein
MHQKLLHHCNPHTSSDLPRICGGGSPIDGSTRANVVSFEVEDASPFAGNKCTKRTNMYKLVGL